MKIINLTPHAIHFYQMDGEILTIPPSGTVARAEEEKEIIGYVGNIPVHKKKFGNIVGLPEPQEDTIYIVSALVAQAVPHRQDVFIPDDTVRDEQGRIIGCCALARV